MPPPYGSNRDLATKLATLAAPGHIADLKSGRFYMAGSGKLELAVAGNVRATVTNPAGSGRNVNIVRISGLATVVGWADLFVNPTTGLPATANRTVMNAIVGGGAPAVGSVKTDTDTTTPLGGGTAIGMTMGIPAGTRLSLDFPPLVLAPGVVLGINQNFAGSSTIALAVYWYESLA